MHYTIRTYKETDLPFIFNSWLKSYKDSDFAKNITDKDFYSLHHLLIEEMLKRPNVNIILIVDAEDTNVVFGWLCHECNVLHYAYVKNSFRHMGLFTKLLAESKIDPPNLVYTHHTPQFNKFYLSKLQGKRLRYVPYLI